MAGVPIGLDFASVMARAAPLGTDLELLAAVLPEFEVAILNGLAGEDVEDEE